MSESAPPSNVSSPFPPKRESEPEPELMSSFPAPPYIESLKSPDERVSSPPRPMILAARPYSSMVSTPSVPTLVPEPVINCAIPALSSVGPPANSKFSIRFQTFSQFLIVIISPGLLANVITKSSPLSSNVRSWVERPPPNLIVSMPASITPLSILSKMVVSPSPWL